MELDSINDFLATTFERSGWAPASARDRQIEDGSQFDRYFSKPNLNKECVKRNGSVEDTVAVMQRIIRSKYTQVEQLAVKELAVRGADGQLRTRATVENIFNFIFKYLKYNLEKGEQLKTPRRTWYSAQVLARQKPGRENSADCDCFSIFAGSCMYALKIPFALKIAGYQGNNYQHVYCVAYDNGKQVICDPVTNRFDYEKPPAISKLFPVNITNMGLSGCDIMVLDGIDDIGDLGKSAKKKAKAEKKAEKKQAKLEKKKAKKEAKAEKKAEKREAKAEKKAEKKIAKAEKKAAKLEKKAEKKGGEKAERLREKAQATRDAAQIKADAIKEKAAEKNENKQKNLTEKFQKKEARLEVKTLKRTGAAKEDIKEAKQKLKDLKKQIKQQKKEDGRGIFRKAGQVGKKIGMSPVRGAFLGLIRVNFRGMATGFMKNKQAYGQFLTKWKKIFGGTEARFKAAITRGSANKPLFGNSKMVKRASEIASKEGYDNIDNLGTLAGGEEVAMYMAIASAALSLAAGILKMCGVSVPDDFEEASKTMNDISQMLDDQKIDASEDGQGGAAPSTPSTPSKGDKALDWMRRSTEIVNDIKDFTTEKELDEPSVSESKDVKDTTRRKNMDEKENKDSGNALKYGAIALALLVTGYLGYRMLKSDDGGKQPKQDKDDKLGLVPLS